MTMIRRAKSGRIEEVTDKNIKTASAPEEPDLNWSSEVVIKDVLDVPLTGPANIDLDLDAEEDDEIDIRR